MAVTNLNFEAQVDAWCRETEARMTAVFRESVKRTVAIMQRPVSGGGNMPVDTGFLRASIRASLSVMPTLNMAKGVGGGGRYDPNAVVLVIASAQLGQTIYIGYTANYAGFVEYGTSRTRPRGYVANATRQWSATVTQVVADLKGRIAARPR